MTVAYAMGDNHILVPAATHARLEWVESNRKAAAKEKLAKEHHNRVRQAEKEELCARVGLTRSASVGRVAASRENMFESKRAQRRGVAVDQRHALAEKDRRLAALREEHTVLYASKFRTFTADSWEASALKRFNATSASGPSTSALAAVPSTPVTITPATPDATATSSRAVALRASPARPASARAAIARIDVRAPKSGFDSKYLSYERMELPDDCMPLDAVLVANAAHARREWAESNRKHAEVMRARKADMGQVRQAQRDELSGRVGLARSASAGKVAASREHVLANKREMRRQEAVEQQRALAEKERRLAALRDEHTRTYRAKFRPMSANEWAANVLGNASAPAREARMREWTANVLGNRALNMSATKSFCSASGASLTAASVATPQPYGVHPPYGYGQ
jgi:hypothetical protein